jgi:hypothetical protein
LLGDIRLACELKQFSGEGSLEFRWAFRDQKVSARIAADGKVEMAGSAAEGGKAREDSTRRKLRVALSAVRRLEFAVRDGQAYLAEGDRLVVAAPVGPQDLAGAKLRLKEATEPCRLAIIGSRCDLTFSRVVLWKDIYHRNLAQIPGAGSEAGLGCTGNPIRLGRGEYFVLGDNSSRSRDSRSWGVVPGDAVIGIARCTYWPPSRWHWFQ